LPAPSGITIRGAYTLGVSAAVADLRPTIDRDWLERVAADEPMVHAFALWNLLRSPDSVRFVSVLQEGETRGYLAIWLGGAGRPIVHAFGPPELSPTLVRALPAPPFAAVLPFEAEPIARRRHPDVQSSSLSLMLRGGGPRLDPGRVRALRREDRPALLELLRAESDRELGAYGGLDPEADPAWGAFDGDRLVGVARAAVRLPSIWIVGGVFVAPPWRGRGLGHALVSAVIDAAEGSGAQAGLYVPEASRTARHLYEGLGFHEVGRRLWVEVGPAVPV
jgi:GNAT superfamily N-acetyltransferase